jgi:phenylpropionate dioxygenase-like ring-hydroxylating dioxygenase large terminal subunit
MLRDHWYAVLESTELPTGRPLGVTRLDQAMVFWRGSDGQPRATHARCCHRGASLAHGELCGEGVACPFHGFIHGGDGRVTLIPANGRAAEPGTQYRVEAWPVREAHGFVWLWFGEPRDELPELPFFEDLAEPGWSWGSIVDDWPIHYTRAIENQLDVVHLPFVHRRSIGRGLGTVVHGPIVKQDGGSIRFWVFSDQDDGRITAKPAAELSAEDASVELEFRFGNIWQNKLGPKFRAFLAFVPVDQDNTRIYLRVYQRFFTVPLLDRLFNWIANQFNLRILREDKAVVLTQQPRRSALKMGEKLIPGDLPIVAFRRYRAERLGD